MLTAICIAHEVLQNVCLSSVLSCSSHNNNVYFLIRNENYESFLVTIPLDSLKIRVAALRDSAMEVAMGDYISTVFLYHGEVYFATSSAKNGTTIEQIGSQAPPIEVAFSCKYVGFLESLGLLIVESETKNIVSVDIATGKLSFITGTYKNIIASSCSDRCVAISFGGMLDGIYQRDSSAFLSGADAKICKEYYYSQKINTIKALCASDISVIGTDKTIEIFDNCRFEKVNTLFTDTVFVGSGIIGANYYTLEAAAITPWYLNLKLYGAKGNLKYSLKFPDNYLVGDKVCTYGKYAVFTAFINNKSKLLAVDTESGALQEFASIVGAIVDFEQYGDILIALSDAGDGKYFVTLHQLECVEPEGRFT